MQFPRVRVDDMCLDKFINCLDTSELKTNWSNEQKSLLIESVIIRVPLNAFYVGAQLDLGKWNVIVGTDKITSINEFLKDGFSLTNVELLPTLNGLRYSQLERNYQRCIE